MHSFRTVFLLFKKYCFHHEDKGAEGKALEKDDYHVSNTFLLRTEEPSYLSRSVKQRGVKSETRSAYLTKGKLLWGISSETERPASPQQMGALSLLPEGERAKEERETRDHKKGWRHGWTVTHVPLRRGILLTWPLVCHHVTSPVMSLHPVRLRCIVLHCVDKGIKENR